MSYRPTSVRLPSTRVIKTKTRGRRDGPGLKEKLSIDGVLHCLARLDFTELLAGMLIGAFVCGSRPMCWLVQRRMPKASDLASANESGLDRASHGGESLSAWTFWSSFRIVFATSSALVTDFATGASVFLQFETMT